MSREKSTQTGNTILVLVAMVLGVLIGLMFSQSAQRRAMPDTLQDKMSEVMRLVDDEYVDAIDVDSLSERLLAVMMRELDPHSAYLSARETARTDEMMRGSFEGVGLVLHREGDTTYVGQVMADGPSAGLGIMPGDKIITVDGDSVSGVGMPADTVVARLRGPRRTMVNVTVQRTGVEELLSFNIRRGVVPRHTVPYYTMLDDTTGYVVLNSFASTSHDEFCEAVQGLKKRGMRRLVFDLRGNGGGSLNAAIDIAGELLPRGSLIVYTEGYHSRRRNVYSRGGGLFTEGSVVVMVDENSASASEVVSGALQDNDRATIVGRRTFGKGLVQTDFALRDGSSVLLTTARYYTPSGRCIQRPYTSGTEEYYRDYLNQLMEETYADSSTVRIADTTPYYTTAGRVVYGGGGIIPDQLLQLHRDSTLIYYNQLASRGLINTVAFGYVRKNASRILGQYPDAESFEKGFRVGKSLVDELVATGEAAGIACNQASLEKQRPLIEAMLKADIGMAIYGEKAFYDSYMTQDDDLKQVMNQRQI